MGRLVILFWNGIPAVRQVTAQYAVLGDSIFIYGSKVKKYVLFNAYDFLETICYDCLP